MNNYFKEIKIPVSKILTTESKNYHGKDWFSTLDFYYKVFQKEFIDKLNSYDKIMGVRIFKRQARNQINFAHFDAYLDDNSKILYALNIVVPCPDPGIMEWYSYKNNFIHKENNIPLEELKLEETHVISNYPTIVRTDIPHRVVCGSSDRMCYSIRFSRDKFKNWNEVYEFYQNIESQLGVS